MEKIRALILPDEFASLKVAKSTLEFIRLEGDLRDRCRLQRILARLDSQRLNLAGFSNVLKVRAVETKDDFPTRHSWDSYFRDAKHMNELKPGERPDTIHISGLPVKWFTEEGGNLPSESLISKIFKKWGTLRRIDVPAADPYRSRMRLDTKIHKFSYEDGIFFDAYIQYVEYMDFVRAMDALRGMKLLKKDGGNALTAGIKIDFDKTKHMSDSTVAHREFERKRLIAQDNLAAEKIRKKEEAEEKRREELKKKEQVESIARDNRRTKREEKRKRKALTIFRKQEEDKVSMKIAREEQKLIKAQRQLESIRLLDELFDRIKIKVEKNEIKVGETLNVNTKSNKTSEKTEKLQSEDQTKDDKKDKKVKKSKRKKSKKEKKKKKNKRKKGSENSASGSDNSDAEGTKKKLMSVLTQKVVHPSSSTETPSTEAGLPYSAIFTRLPQPWYYEEAVPLIYPTIPRGVPTRGGRFSRGRGRGFLWRNSGNPRGLHPFNPHLYNEQYYKYFAHLVGQDYRDFESDCDRSSRSHSYKRSASRSRSRLRSRSRSRSETKRSSRSRSKRYTRSRTRSRSRKRKGRSRSRSTSRVRSRSRRKSHSRSRSKSRRRSHSRSRSKSRSVSEGRCRRRRGGLRSSSRVRVTRAKSRSTSSKRRSRSSTWSMPRSPTRRSCSWSKSIDTANSKTDGDHQKSKEMQLTNEKEIATSK